MSIDRTGVMRPIYGITVEPSEDSIEISLIPGSATPVKLSLAFHGPANLTKAAIDKPEGAILDVCMRQEDAQKLLASLHKKLIAK